MKILSYLTLFGIFLEKNAWAAEAQSSHSGMTLWQTLQSGGVVMVILGILSLIILSLMIFLLLYLDPLKLVPSELTHKCLQYVTQKKYDLARKAISGNESLVKNIILAGLDRVNLGEEAVHETVELTARKEVTTLWSFLNYISDIGQVAPMLGLLGNVLGMIRAFNNVAFETGVVKPIALAGGVAEAMITTAGGLSIGILAMIIYPIIRARVQNITNLLETETSVILKAFSHGTA
ncbi:MAG TPA: MotA/TolQ/ExbB proton channel family protein [Verrucomicrobiae bacterium]|jgi:biopolymer transport protein ExbB|nr:MotA/TolQ/ExbB proton channel family protein [Verrucomicrobiae bacterium]